MEVWVALLVFLLPAAPPQASKEDLRNKAWVDYLKGPVVRTCHARVQAGPTNPMLAESLADMSVRTDTPTWVLIPLNLGYDLMNLEEDDLFVIPYPSPECVDPARSVQVPSHQ